MKKVRELWSRSKVKIKKIFDSDEAPTRPPTPIPPNNPSSFISPSLGQTPSHAPPNPAGPSVSINLLTSTADQEERTVPAAESVPSHMPLAHTETLASTVLSTPAPQTATQELPAARSVRPTSLELTPALNTPIPPNNPSSLISPSLGQAPVYALPNLSGLSDFISPSGSSANQAEPTVPAVEQVP
ncbi:hypothetical protein RSAG8_08632, partial [Rhizoctonia solani AG-8 WAC10335]